VNRRLWSYLAAWWAGNALFGALITTDAWWVFALKYAALTSGLMVASYVAALLLTPGPIVPCVYCGKDTYPRRRVLILHPYLNPGMAAHITCGPRGWKYTVVSLIRYYRFR
jgi:hypothetical protein